MISEPAAACITEDGLNIQTNTLDQCKRSHASFQQSFRHVPAQGTPWQSAGVPCTTEDLRENCFEVAYGSLQCARSMIVDGQVLQVSCTGCQAVLPSWEVTAPLV